MPVGPNGEIRPVSTISAAAMVCEIATGEIKEQYIQDRDKDTIQDRDTPSKNEKGA